MRVLGRVRLSRSHDRSTSVERQREIIQQWADANGHTVVAWAEDIDVSGSLSPFDAPELGKYFKEPLCNDWDVLVAWKLDRLARRSIPLHHLFGWIQEHDKTLVCVADNIDLSTWVGRMVAGVIAGVAEGELEAITERITASKRKLRSVGRWDGGCPPYGWRPVKLETGGWKLEFDPETQPVLQRIIAEIMEGRSANAIAKDLAEEGIPSPFTHMNRKSKGEWDGTVIRKMLRKKSLMGWRTHDAIPVLTKEGKPVELGPPALSPTEFQALQEKLDERANQKSRPDTASMLLHVLKCWYCGSDMYMRRTSHAGGVHLGYHCSKKCCKQHTINGIELQKAVDDLFQWELGKYTVRKKITRYSDTQELEEAKAAYDDIASFISHAQSATARQSLMSQLDVLGQRIEQLSSQPSHEDVWEETDSTYGDLWRDADDQGKRKILLDAGVTIRARQLTRGTRHGPGAQEIEFNIPEELQAILDK